ncbi:hypothetical protein V1264_012601 [Littorina saxatilis]|uniref:RING-type domain-containing protein n=1 Tax=Littorina saxatilis TaxID=31220 RepID=A0AAN9BYA6_9CAEN
MNRSKAVASKNNSGTPYQTPSCILQLAAVQAVLHHYNYTQDQVLKVAQRMLHKDRPGCFRSARPDDNICGQHSIEGLDAASLTKELEAEFGLDRLGVPTGGGMNPGACVNAEDVPFGRQVDCQGSVPPARQGLYGFGGESSREEELEEDSAPGPSTHPEPVRESAHSDVPASAASATSTSRDSSLRSHNHHLGNNHNNFASSHEIQPPFPAPSSKGEVYHHRNASGFSSQEHSDFLKEEMSPSLFYNGQVPDKVSEGPRRKEELSRELRQKVAALRRENSKLKARTLCRHCRKRPANLTLLPCGHFCLCAECGSTFDQCPVCRKTVLADIKTFVS